MKKATLEGGFVARAGFEPTQSEPKSEVLPLDDRASIAFQQWATKVKSYFIFTKF
jgi:hypothetical protein